MKSPISTLDLPALTTIRRIIFIVAMFVASPALVLAHGGGVSQLAAEPVGPYELFAWTSPDPARAGTVHVTVALAEPATDEPVLNAGVRVQMLPLAVDAEAQPLTAEATHAGATNKVTYETDLEVPAAGRWQVTIAVDTAEGGGDAAFDLDVKPRSYGNWLLFGAGALAVAVAVWLFWPGGQRADVGGQKVA